MKNKILLVASFLFFNSFISSALAASRDIDVTAIVLMSTKGQLTEEKYNLVKAEFSAIDELKIEALKSIHQSRGAITINIELTEEATFFLKKKFGKSINLVESSPLKIRKTGLKDLDKVNKILKSESIELAIYEDGTGYLSVELNGETSKKLNLLSATNLYKSIPTVKTIDFSNAFIRRGGFGNNPSPIEKLNDNGLLSKYLFWEASGDCMAGCIGNYFQIEIDKSVSPFKATLVSTEQIPRN